MASILSGFEYDIFISYRHNDNRSDWVTDFVSALREELAATIKEPVSVYFDSNPHDGLLEIHQVDKSLEGKLKCLIFIPIISQTYCDTHSFAWQHEFCTFNRLVLQDPFGRDIRLSSGNVASRILPIKIHDLDDEDKAAIELETGGVLRAIEFIFKSPGVNRPLSVSDNPEKNSSKTLYRDQINKVANGVKEILSGLKDFDPLRNPSAQKVATVSPRVPLDVKKTFRIITVALAVILVAGYILFNVAGMISLSKREQMPIHKVILPIAILAIILIVARQPSRKMGFTLIQLASVFIFAGGLMDILFTFISTKVPDNYLAYLQVSVEEISKQMVSLEFALLRSLGTALVAVGLGAWLLLMGPVKQGSKAALAGLVAMVTVAEGNNSIQLYGVDSPFYMYTLIIVLITWVGALLWWKGDVH